MNESQYYKELSKCVRCGACKALCPTYLSTLDETMGARGRIAMLGALRENELTPTKNLSDKIFSCILCGACGDLCPTGINIPETIYEGRAKLKDHYRRGRLLAKIMKFSLSRTNTFFSVLRGLQKFIYPPLYKAGRLRYIPAMAPSPFKKNTQVYKNKKKIGRIVVFAGCSVNYFYPHLGDSLIHILMAKGYEVIVLSGEICCGAPMRSLGFKKEAVTMAKKNIELFNKLNTEAILCMCPTCTMTIKKQYPIITGETIEKIMDVNEFFIKNKIIQNLKTGPRVVTYHDPCHLRYGLGIENEPREILKGIQGIKFVEMQNAGDCCGFGGFFSQNFKELSKTIGKKKINSICNTSADTVVTSCPGCMMQLEDIKNETGTEIDIMHIVEIIYEAMHG
ncbi:MAG: (Fe-S)-binding protein [Candidatus Mariimomonas ferrooxydans]